MRISLIVAKSLNNVIGVNNTLPWHLKDDLQNFKKITTGHHILMGRKTFDSIGKPLPNRVSLVISGSSHPNTDNVFWFTSIFRAIKQAERSGETELFIIGGEKIFKAALPLVDRLYLSNVHCEIKGDVFFPSLSLKNWKLISSSFFDKSEHNDHSFEFQILDRRLVK